MPDVILPVLDEIAAIPGVLAAMPHGYRAIIVDNGSSDGSGELARSLGAMVVQEQRRGFGAACHAGLTAASAEIVCFMDCDGSLDPHDLPRLVSRLLDGSADLVLGRRRPTRGAWPVHARVANTILTQLLRTRARVSLSDLGPMRAARRESLLALDLRDRQFGYPLEMVLVAARSGLRVQELPVTYSPRLGSSKVTGSVRGTARAIRDMSRVLAR